jgi:hypothetical protein
VRKISAKPLEELAISTKADCLRSVWPLVEKKLASGTSHADVLRALNEGGFELTERTYKSYVYRLRKERRDGKRPQTPAIAHSAPGYLASTQPFAATSASAPTGGRPRTFNYDPRGNPDLLK